MNKSRRSAIAVLISRLSDLENEANDIASAIDLLQEEEQEGFDNLPEGLQVADQGAKMEAAAEALSEASSAVDEVTSALQDVASALETASE